MRIRRGLADETQLEVRRGNRARSKPAWAVAHRGSVRDRGHADRRGCVVARFGNRARQVHRKLGP